MCIGFCGHFMKGVVMAWSTGQKFSVLLLSALATVSVSAAVYTVSSANQVTLEETSSESVSKNIDNLVVMTSAVSHGVISHNTVLTCNAEASQSLSANEGSDVVASEAAPTCSFMGGCCCPSCAYYSSVLNS